MSYLHRHSIYFEIYQAEFDEVNGSVVVVLFECEVAEPARK